MDVKSVCKRLLPTLNLAETTSKELRQMVAQELHCTIDTVSQADIDAAMLEALDQLVDDPVDTHPVKAPRLKSVKRAKVAKPTRSTAASTIIKSTKERRRSSTKKEASVDRLKSYVNKCGVRKVWKRELDGLSAKESIAKLECILRELGMEGRPTLEKCKQIKKRREFEEEMREIDPRNIISTRLRHQNDNKPQSGDDSKPVKSRAMVISSDDDDDGDGDGDGGNENATSSEDDYDSSDSNGSDQSSED